ncbi:hypothetical protein N657DRAFT_656622 [Parathielavia appendiculata]|uniref:Uncharacterized protein n=1 Tax=Parathielavia appendiculata TaxID=2587402 RepID=A0AAN6TZW8_9PEZI|nr:hypothetical protein N657DRAFT_656622 [Parathielavia appendiculata]
MPGEGFITIHGAQPSRQPGTAAANRPPPPPPGYAGQQPARQPAGRQQYRPQQPGPQHQTRPDWPAPSQIPQANTHVKISDLRRERPPTAEEAREATSEYYVFRFTRADEGGYASDGSKRKPSWKRALRVEVPGITNQEAARTVRNLNRTTIPAAEKKKSLSEEEQRQIEIALEDLQKKHDDALFQTTLVQLDDRVREKPKEKEKRREKEREGEKDRRKERYRKDYGLYSVTRVPSKTHHRPKETNKVVTERVSITAYFKRAPRPGVDPIAILQHRDTQRNAQLRGMQQPYAQHAQLARPVARPEVAPLPPSPQTIPPPRAAGTRGPSPGRHTQTYYRGHGVAIVQPAPQRGTHATVRRASPSRPSPRRPSPRIRQGARSPPSTDESSYSETFSVLDGEDTDCTSPTTASYLSSRDSFERLRKPRPQYREGPAHYGIQPNFNGGTSQVPVHIQPHRTHDRPLSPRRRNSMSAPNRAPFPPHPTSTTPPGFLPPRPANVAGTGTVPPMPPSPPAPIRMPTGEGIGMGGSVQNPPPPRTAGHVPGHHFPPPPPGHIPPLPQDSAPNQTGITGQISPPPPQLQPGKTPVVVNQIYAEAYAAGREEALSIAERVVAAASTKTTRGGSPVPVVIQHDRPKDHGRGRSRSLDRGRERRRYRSRSLDRDQERSLSLDRGRGRSLSLDRYRTRGRTRTRSRSLDYRIRDRGRDRSREREQSGKDRHWDRGRNRSLDGRDRARPPSPRVLPGQSRPRSGVRIVRPEDGYTRHRVGMDREGLERYHGGGRTSTTRTWTREVPGDTGTDRDDELRYERLRREDADRMIREEKERERRAKGEPPFGNSSNPFAPRPGLKTRTGATVGRGGAYA